jgi:hypothetical protein
MHCKFPTKLKYINHYLFRNIDSLTLPNPFYDEGAKFILWFFSVNSEKLSPNLDEVG